MPPHVTVVSTGGTIASTSASDDAGKTPTESGADLLEAVPELGEYATIDLEDVCRVSGFQMDAENATKTLEAVERAGGEADGVVVTHGTDTMAETAYYLALAADLEAPVVFTGAQRPFDQLGTDGPSNLLAAVRTAADERFRTGSYLAFNDTVHAARHVVKAHTSKLETFSSPDYGPVAEFTPGGLRLLAEPGRYAEPMAGVRLDPAVEVEIVTNALGVDGSQVRRALEADVDGIVLTGTGLGNATAALGRALESALEAGVPVVLTSRCHAGAVAGLYGGPGGAKTLLEAGAIPGGDLPPWKARLKLALALSRGDDLEAVRSVFENDRSSRERLENRKEP